ncbi:MAG: integration host factor subunit beta [Rhodothermales bacterium]|nr:integration host factor subunit beta [Rhodothermales bacterium]
MNSKYRSEVTKADIVDRIASATGLTKLETEAVVNGFMESVRDALIEGDTVHLRGFGSFKSEHRAPRTARNPRTNVEVKIGERYVPVFKPSRDLRDAVDKASR